MNASTRDRLRLLDSEHAWLLEFWQINEGRLLSPSEPPALSTLQEIATPLLLEVVTVPPDNVRIALIHRSGWPFDLTCCVQPSAGQLVVETRPKGAGDAVMLDFLQEIEQQVPGITGVLAQMD